MNLKDAEIANHLKSTYEMLKSAFPHGIKELEYYSVIALLYNHMSDRNLAEVVSLFTGKDTFITLNDVYKSVTTKEPSDEEKDSVKKKLLEHGFNDWINE